MIEWAIEPCRKRGRKIVQLISDKSRDLYSGLGFEAPHEGIERSL